MKELRTTLQKNDWEISKRENPYLVPIMWVGGLLGVLLISPIFLSTAGSFEEWDFHREMLLLGLILAVACYGIALVFPIPFFLGDSHHLTFNKKSDLAFLYPSLLDTPAIARKNFNENLHIFLRLLIISLLIAVSFSLVLHPSFLPETMGLFILLLSQSIFSTVLAIKAMALKRVFGQETRKECWSLRLLVLFVFFLSMPVHGLLITERLNPLLVLPSLLLLYPTYVMVKHDIPSLLDQGWYEPQEWPMKWASPPAARQEEEVRELPRETGWFEKWIFDPAAHHMKEEKEGFGAVLEMQAILEKRKSGGIEYWGLLVLSILVCPMLYLTIIGVIPGILPAILIEGMLVCVFLIFMNQLPSIRGKEVSFLYLLPIPAKTMVERYFRVVLSFFLLVFLLLGIPSMVLTTDRALLSTLLFLHGVVFTGSFVSFMIWANFASMKEYLLGRAVNPLREFRDMVKIGGLLIFYFLHVLASFVMCVVFYTTLHPVLGLVLLVDTVFLLLVIPRFSRNAILAYDQMSIHN